jgi:hypothetical protein
MLHADADAVVSVSEFVASYGRRHSCLDVDACVSHCACHIRVRDVSVAACGENTHTQGAKSATTVFFNQTCVHVIMLQDALRDWCS